MKIKVEIDYEQVDKIVLAAILDSMEYTYADYRNLKKADKLKDYEQQDFDLNKEFLKAGKIVYGWFSIDNRALEKFKL